MENLAWLDVCFMQNILRKAEKDESIEVSDIIVKAATAKGDNFMSDIYRVTVTLSRIHNECKVTETKTVIAKVAPQDQNWCKTILKSGIYDTEIYVMRDILPKINHILAGLKGTSLTVRGLGFHNENPTYLIIEDLMPKGFRMSKRAAVLDLDHALLAIRNIASFHAASVALAEKDPAVTKCLPWYKKTLEGTEDSIATHIVYLGNSTKALGREVANWPELSPRISEKILNLSEVIHDKYWDAADLLQDDFNVLNHGDYMLNNMLFRYNEDQKPIEQTFVDFQFTHYGSPAFDILYFLGGNLSFDLRFNNRDLILREYHESLTSTMEKLGCTTKAPSFDGLQDILKKRAFIEVVPSVTTLAHVLVDRSEVKDIMELVMSDKNPGHPAYRGEMYRNIMTKVLPVFESMGLLDV